MWFSGRSIHKYVYDLQQQPPVCEAKLRYLYIKIVYTKLMCSKGVYTRSFLKNCVRGFVQPKIFVPSLIQRVWYQH